MKLFLRILNGIVFAPVVIPAIIFGLWCEIDNRIVKHYKKRGKRE